MKSALLKWLVIGACIVCIIGCYGEDDCKQVSWRVPDEANDFGCVRYVSRYCGDTTGRSVSGKIQCPQTGKAVQGVVVFLTCPSCAATDTTDKEGFFSVECVDGVGEEAAQLRLTKKGYRCLTVSNVPFYLTLETEIELHKQ